MNLEEEYNPNEQIIIINPNVHLKSKLSRTQFLDKLINVEYIRTVNVDHFLTFYITSNKEFRNISKFHNLINKHEFDLNYENVFLVEISPKVFNWFKNTNLNIILKQIACWLTGLYFFNPEKQEILEEQIYLPLKEEIKKNIILFKKYFSDWTDLNNNTEILDYNKDRRIEWANKYKSLCNEFYNCDPPEFLSTLSKPYNINGWGLNKNFAFDFKISYFSENDWKNIIEKNSKDNLSRVESRRDLWEKWKHTFGEFDKTGSVIYDFYNCDNNKVLNSKIKRDKIPHDVKDKVWKRDEGKCVECGSKEKLEFDHIIPVILGGASSYRNLQILCEACNRKKYNKI